MSTDSATCDFTTRIGDNNFQTSINIYPNPCSDYFVITIPENSELNHQVLTIQLRNVFGQQIFNKKTFSDNPKIRIATDEIPKGTYLLQIEAESQNILNKLIIVN